MVLFFQSSACGGHMNTKSAIITFRVTPSQFKRLKQYAKDRAETVTKIIQSRIAEIIG